MKDTKSVRLVIGRDEMNAFAGLSDGDVFGCVNGGTWKVRNTSYGISLRPLNNTLGAALPGFDSLPDYHSFVRAVNNAAMNGIAEENAK